MEKNELLFYVVLFEIIISFGLMIYNNTCTQKCITTTYKQENTKPDIAQIMDDIEKQCGSTHITKRFGSNEWYVFKMDITSNGDHYEYIKLKDCYKTTGSDKNE